MRLLSTLEKARAIQTALETLNDLCSIHTPTTTQDTFGQQSKTWATTNNVACGFNPNTPKKSYRDGTVTLDCDAILRLALTQSMDIHKEITCRGNRYKIQGVQNGITVYIIPLKRVETND